VDRYQYFLVLAACLLITLPLEFVFRARVWARFGKYLQALALPFLLFNAVNEWAILRRLWRYSSTYTTGWRVPRQYPVEEIAFFVVIPLCAVLTFETARNVYEGRVPPLREWFCNPTAAKEPRNDMPHELMQTPTPSARRYATVAGALGLFGAAIVALTFLALRASGGQGQSAARNVAKKFYRSTFDKLDWEIPDYTVIVLLLLAIVLLVERVLRSHIFLMRAYWVTMAISAGFMILVNGWLTKQSAPIVIYAGEEFLLGRIIWDIPTEDFAFGFALLTMVLTCWIKVTGVRVTGVQVTGVRVTGVGVTGVRVTGVRPNEPQTELQVRLENRVTTVDEVDLAGVPTG
jgi:lycopene beta-cyclase